MSSLTETPKVSKQKSSVLVPRYRKFTERRWRESTVQLTALSVARAALEAAGNMAGSATVTGLMADVQKGQRRMLGADF